MPDILSILFRPLLACAAALAMAGCVGLPQVDRQPSAAATHSTLDELGAIAQPCFDKPGQSCFRALPVSAFSIDARLTLAAHAKRTLDVQYYLLQDDATGHALLAALRDASLRGVRVRVLVDDLYTARSEPLLSGLAAYPNIEIRLFNPFAAGRSSDATRWLASAFEISRVNHRMHNKLFIADAAFAVAGGRNIADEYFFKSGEGNFVDFDVLLTGQAVPDLEAVYDVYWNSQRVFPLTAFDPQSSDAQAQRAAFDERIASLPSPFKPLSSDARDLLGHAPLSADILHPPLALMSGHIDVWADNPEKVSGRSETGTDASTVTSRMLAAVAGSQSDVQLISPYFVPGAAGMAALEDARKRGVRVSVLTNSMAANDEPFASAAYARYRQRMLRMGISISEISPHALAERDALGDELGKSIGRMHAKLLIFDNRRTFVGSMNLDLRSSRENTELGLLIDSPEFASEVSRLVGLLRNFGTYTLRWDESTQSIQWIERGPEGTSIYNSEPAVGLSTRIEVLLLSPLIAEDLL
jgi:putative cardiolipin synthase